MKLPEILPDNAAYKVLCFCMHSSPPSLEGLRHCMLPREDKWYRPYGDMRDDPSWYKAVKDLTDILRIKKYMDGTMIGGFTCTPKGWAYCLSFLNDQIFREHVYGDDHIKRP